MIVDDVLRPKKPLTTQEGKIICYETDCDDEQMMKKVYLPSSTPPEDNFAYDKNVTLSDVPPIYQKFYIARVHCPKRALQVHRPEMLGKMLSVFRKIRTTYREAISNYLLYGIRTSVEKISPNIAHHAEVIPEYFFQSSEGVYHLHIIVIREMFRNWWNSTAHARVGDAIWLPEYDVEIAKLSPVPRPIPLPKAQVVEPGNDDSVPTVSAEEVVEDPPNARETLRKKLKFLQKAKKEGKKILDRHNALKARGLDKKIMDDKKSILCKYFTNADLKKVEKEEEQDIKSFKTPQERNREKKWVHSRVQQITELARIKYVPKASAKTKKLWIDNASGKAVQEHYMG